MARTAGSQGARTSEAIREAGLRLIFEHGYEGMSLRDLAVSVGLQPGSLYNHIATKQTLLFDLLSAHMLALTEALDEALSGAESPLDRLNAFITFHLRYHLSRKMEVFVVNSELRSLDLTNYEAIVALRDAYEQRLVDILSACKAARTARMRDVRVTAYAILALLTGVVSWYRPDGRLSVRQIIDLHRDLVLRGVLPEPQHR